MRKVIDGNFLAMLEGRDLQVHSAMNGMFGGNRRSAVYGSSAEFADYRDYTPGDDLRRIDWNLYARFEKLYLKLFTDERQLHHRIYIDTSASMDWGEPNKGDMALKIAAALGFLSVQAMDRVSFYAISGNTCTDLCRTVMGREAFYSAADTLNTLEFDGESDIGAAICSQEDPGDGSGISVVISDFLPGSNWKQAVDSLVFHRRQVHLLQILSPDELEPDFSGKVLLLDAEAQGEEDPRNLRMDITRSAVRAYGEALRFCRQELSDYCTARGGSFTALCSDESIGKMLFDHAVEGGLVL